MDYATTKIGAGTSGQGLSGKRGTAFDFEMLLKDSCIQPRTWKYEKAWTEAQRMRIVEDSSRLRRSQLSQVQAWKVCEMGFWIRNAGTLLVTRFKPLSWSPSKAAPNGTHDLDSVGMMKMHHAGMGLTGVR